MFLDIVEMCVSFWQLVATTVNIPTLSLPVEWEALRAWVSVLQLNVISDFATQILPDFHDISIIHGPKQTRSTSSPFATQILPDFHDIRVYFICICAAVPIALALSGMLVMNPLYVLIWYAAAVVGVCLTAAGGYAMFLEGQHDFAGDEKMLVGLTTIGVLTVIGCVAAALLFLKFKAKYKIGERSTAETVKQRMEEDTEKLPKWRVASLLVCAAGLSLLGAMLIADPLEVLAQSPDVAFQGVDLKQFRSAAGYASIAFAVVCLCLLPLHCFQGTRRVLWRIGRFIQRHFMRVLLMLMAFTYIPVGSGLFLVFNCNDVTCPPGMQFRGIDSLGTAGAGRVAGNNDTAIVEALCMPCVIDRVQVCPAKQLHGLCQNYTESRLENDKRFPCSYMKRFFWPASAAIVVSFLIGVPVIFQSLIFVATGKLMDDIDFFPMDDDTIRETEGDYEATYAAKIDASRNAVKFLHDAYEPQWRYARLYMTLHRLATVFATVFILRVPSDSDPAYAALFITLAVHLLLLGWLSWKMPYADLYEDVAAIILQVCLVLSTIAALLTQAEVDVPAAVLHIIAILDLVVPIVTTVIGIGLAIIEWRSREKRGREETARKVEELVDRMEDEEMTRPLIGSPKSKSSIHDPFASTAPPSIVTSSSPDYASVYGSPSGSPRAGANYGNGNGGMIATVVKDPFLGTVNGGTGTGSGMTAATAAGKDPFLTSGNDEAELRARADLEAERRLKALNQVKVEAAHARQALLTRQDDADLVINTAVRERLNLYLMLFGIIACVALGIAVLGLREERSLNSFTVPPSRSNTETQFAGKASWAQFSTSCCCASSGDDGGQIVERWDCYGGRTKLRLRSEVVAVLSNGTKVIDSGLVFRDVCSRVFKHGCYLNVTRPPPTGAKSLPPKTVTFGCPAGAFSAADMPSTFAFEQMW